MVKMNVIKTIPGLSKKSLQIRKLLLDTCCSAGTGHVTSSFSCTEILVALYYGGILEYDIANPAWDGRDRFILSKGQASPLLYTVLGDLGFFPRSDLGRFCSAKGRFGVHLQHDVPGVEVTTGSLGHGLGIGIGIALAARLNRKLYTTFVLLGDGECYEGSIWESAMFAAHQKLNNIFCIVDRNFMCATDFTENCVALTPLAEKWRSFGWEAVEIDGHSFEEIYKALAGFRSRRRDKPLVVIANTVKGRGVGFMSDRPLWHSMAPKGEEAQAAKREILSGGEI